MSAPEFHRLRIAEVDRLTDESVAITFEVPPEMTTTFAYLAGQHVTVRADIEGVDVRRSYSICSNANVGVLRIAVKRIPEGTFSSFAMTLAADDHLDVMAPVGAFTIDPATGRRAHYAAIVAGSGITPVLSMIATVLDTEPESRFTLLYGNRATNTIMFLEELAALKDTHPERLHVAHVLSREPQLVDLFHGRLDPPRLIELFDAVVDAESVDRWYLCGPYDMVHDARRLLVERGVDVANIADELFFDDRIPPRPPEPEEATGSAVTFSLDGRSSTVRVDPEGAPILDFALAKRPDLPFACKGGVCATCKAKVVSGEVRMDQNWALVNEETAVGLVLTCQAHPVSEQVELDYDV